MNGPLQRGPWSGLLALACAVIIGMIIAIALVGEPEHCEPSTVCEVDR